ncbi:hypothetical protein N480_19200 [Pseudoalteromonas luteoviolacea S2607]|uniref:cupin-like domain-containing protein n=1 Tax=Pseudoalteromonas luteoviolacea TaxID=43657 RepID=UPI0007B0A0FE|nr:cupin-like domain-containing protein [Pseudoalteromonas luteoviolacea]KZN35313.1 hypothetical protein N480_19200 [Pseudoalteromonas luteoviolacea S2607]
MVGEIKRIDFSTPGIEKIVRENLNNSVPFIITNALNETPTWDVDYLESKLGDFPCNVRYYGKKKFSGSKSDWQLYIKSMQATTFSEYADQLRSGTAFQNRIYYAQQEIDDTALEIEQMQNIVSRFGLKKKSGFNIWCGPDGHREPLHYDHADGFLFQLHGNKRVRLFPYSQTKNLYPFPANVTVGWWFSQVDLDNPDFNRFPNVYKAYEHMLEFILEEKEILVIPWGWWHENESRGDKMTCSVNQFFYSRPWWRSTALSPRPLVITAEEKWRDIKTRLGVRTNAYSRSFTINKNAQLVQEALLNKQAITSWYNKDISWPRDDKFVMQVNRNQIDVNIRQESANKICWELGGHPSGFASGRIVYEITPTLLPEYINIKATQFDVTPAATKHLKGMLNHSLISLKDYVEVNEGDPFLAC